MSYKSDIFKSIIRIVLPKFDNIFGTITKKAIPMDGAEFSKVYEQLKKSGFTTVDSLIKWMQVAKIIDESLVTERRMRKMFAPMNKGVQVDLEEFETIMERMNGDNQKLVEDVTQMLVSGTPKMMEALVAAAEAFEETMKKD